MRCLMGQFPTKHQIIMARQMLIWFTVVLINGGFTAAHRIISCVCRFSVVGLFEKPYFKHSAYTAEWIDAQVVHIVNVKINKKPEMTSKTKNTSKPHTT